MTEVQSILFDKNCWNERQAIKWLVKNKQKPIKTPHYSDKYIRFRMKDPTKFYKFRSRKIRGKDITLVFGFKRPQKNKKLLNEKIHRHIEYFT